ncbi:MAG: chitobiase/beta-hexosaminidase C-terminal domain-containing protein [Geobacter sp.]|nr:chitobiase/beta-hexosaminidase C-terminal domain-containing protein [Geobacter sp.]
MKKFILTLAAFMVLPAIALAGKPDKTKPITTATPPGGTYSATQSVTLTVSEPATTYYTTNGTTPTTSSPVYTAPISISVTTALKFFSKDTAGNSETVKTENYTIGTAKTHDPANTSFTWTGYGMCKDCHLQQAKDMYQSMHYQWKGSAAEWTTGPATQGKMDASDGSSALNAYCVNIQGNWGPCGACHLGTGAKPVATNNPSDAQLSSIDCLMCHSSTYARVRNATTGLFEPKAGVDMNNVVRTVIKPTRGQCLGCHAKAGGGDGVKRGDLALATATNTDFNYDAHMVTSGANLACQGCHTFTSHKVAGRGTDIRPLDSTVAINCSSTTCHPTKTQATGHTTADINHHVGRLACQTCHIKQYARGFLTETHRTWVTAEWSSVLGRWEPTPTKAGNLTPKYAFWNGMSWGNNAFDNAVFDTTTNAYKISRPVGAINGSSDKLFPFKYKTANQPLANGKLVTLATGTYFATGNYDQAVKDGLVYMGMGSTTPYSTVTTDEYQLLNHQVMPGTQALTCAECHPETSTTVMKLKTELGYALKGPTTEVCAQCHTAKTPGSFDRIHSRHVATEGFDCSFCHNFSRPERGLSTTPH